MNPRLCFPLLSCIEISWVRKSLAGSRFVIYTCAAVKTGLVESELCHPSWLLYPWGSLTPQQVEIP